MRDRDFYAAAFFAVLAGLFANFGWQAAVFPTLFSIILAIRGVGEVLRAADASSGERAPKTQDSGAVFGYGEER